jgi:hypothetical protein
MLHFLPIDEAEPVRPAAYAEAVARLASVRQALRLVDMTAGAAATPVPTEADFAQVWPAAAPATVRTYNARTSRTANGAAAGLEAILGLQSRGHAPNPAAVAVLSDDIREGLEEIALLFANRG